MHGLVAAGVLVGALVSVVASPASARVVRGRNGHTYGVTLRRGVDPRSLAGAITSPTTTPDTGQLTYYGGPVLHSSAPYLIFWDPGAAISDKSRTLMAHYFTDGAAASGQSDNVYAVTRQYYDSSGFADYSQTFDPNTQVVVDSNPYPTKGNCTQTSGGYSTCVTDAQLQSELQQLITSRKLPTYDASQPTAGAPVYFVVLPSDVNLCNPNLGSGECADNEFCSYHSSFGTGGNTSLYAAMPMALATASPKRCQPDGLTALQEPNTDLGDVVINDISHEYSEMITDPLANGWYDPASGNEEADGCFIYAANPAPASGSGPNAFAPTLGGDATAGTLYDQLIHGNQYYTQSEWSNGDASCQLRTASGTIFTEPTGPNAVGSPLAFTLPAGDPVKTVTWDFGDGTPTLDLTGPVSASHVYTVPGTYTVTVTLVEDDGNVQTVSEPPITVYALPTASFQTGASSYVAGEEVPFDASSSSGGGGVITAYSWSFGDGSPAASGALPSHPYVNPGTYTVTLTVTSSTGLTDSVSQPLTIVDEAPTAGFVIATPRPAARVPVRFDASFSKDSDGSISSYAWSFGDGWGASGINPRHAYARPGRYVVSLTVRDSAGQSATTSSWIVVVRGGQITKVSLSGRGTAKLLAVTLDGPGTLLVGSRRFAVGKPTTVKLSLHPSSAQRGRLHTKHLVRMTLPIRFLPQLGVRSALRVAVSFSA